jgi:hypothetical protein
MTAISLLSFEYSDSAAAAAASSMVRPAPNCRDPTGLR